MLDRMFGLKAEGVTARGEIIAGTTVFFTMAYILVVNPQILSAAGMDRGAAFVATAIAAALTTLMMGLYANLPIALAPGMGQNVYFAFTVVPLLSGDWRLALGCVFLSGILFVVISASPAREWLINTIPQSQKSAIGVGIGFFLALIGFENAGWISPNPTTLLQAGILAEPKALIAAGALFLIAILWARRVPGAVLIGILTSSAVSLLLGLTKFSPLTFSAISLAPTFLQLHMHGASPGIITTIVLVFLLLDLLDTSGTLTAVGKQAGLMRDGHLKNARRALISDATGTMVGALLGTSPVTAYIESATGAGGKTGLVAVTVAILFLMALAFAPLIGMVPAFATAPALIFVAGLFAKDLKDIAWDDLSEALPALITALAIPFTFSIATGIGMGFVTFCGMKLLCGRWREVGPGVAVIALAYATKVAFNV